MSFASVSCFSRKGGRVLSLSHVSPGKEETPVDTLSFIIPPLQVVTGQILSANWHTLQGCIIYEACVRNLKDSYSQYEHKQNTQLGVSAIQRGCSCLVIALHIFFTFLNCNTWGLVVCFGIVFGCWCFLFVGGGGVLCVCVFVCLWCFFF